MMKKKKHNFHGDEGSGGGSHSKIYLTRLFILNIVKATQKRKREKQTNRSLRINGSFIRQHLRWDPEQDSKE